MELLLVFIASFVGSGLKAIGGFGFATLTTPAVALFWDVPTAIAVISVPTMLTSILNGWRAREALPEGFKPFIPFFLASIAGLGIGLTLLLKADPGMMKFILGAFLLGQVIWQWVHRESAKPPENSPARAVGMGAVAGVMLGTVGMPSHIIASYLTGLRLSKSRYLLVLSVSQVCLRLVAVASLLAAGAYSREAVWLMIAVSVPVFMGYFAGSRLYDWLPEKAFFRTVLAILLAMAVSLVVGNSGVVFSWWSTGGV